MPMIYIVTAYCDTPDCVNSEEDALAWCNDHSNKKDAWEELKEHGWKRRNGKLVCCDCVDTEKAEKEE